MFKLISNLFSKSTAPYQEKNSIRKSETRKYLNNTVAFQGDLSVITIENLMELMSHAGLSGELYLAAPDNDACFNIRSGALVFGHMESDFQRIGERLVQGGFITNENLQECLQLSQKESGKQRLGEILVGKQFILKSHLEEIIKEQVKDCFFRVLSWNQGTFTFCVNESPPEEDILLDERIDHLIIEGVIALDQNFSSPGK